MTATPGLPPGGERVAVVDGGDGLVRSLPADITAVKEARAYTIEHFGFSKRSFVGHMQADDFDKAVDHVIDFADWAMDMLRRLVNEVDPLNYPGLTEDIAYTLGLIQRWTCQDCGCVNGHHEAFCYRCGAAPDDDPTGGAPNE